jgi:hypothetical protein
MKNFDLDHKLDKEKISDLVPTTTTKTLYSINKMIQDLIGVEWNFDISFND